MDSRTDRGTPSFLDQAKNVAYRLTHAVGYGALGAVVGAGVGFFTRSPKAPSERTEEDLVNGLKENVRVFQMIRQITPALEGFMREQEYSARRQLEEMGYYPCSRCGIPHKEGGKQADCDLRGTYETKDGKKVSPEDEAWSVDGYEQATGKKWNAGPVGDDDDDGGETVH